MCVLHDGWVVHGVCVDVVDTVEVPAADGCEGGVELAGKKTLVI